MNKNLLKIGALALGMFSFGLVITNTNAQEITGEVSLTINSGESTCDYGTNLTFTAQEVKMDSGYTFQSNFLTGEGQTNTWSCIDRAAENTWNFYVTTSDLLLSWDATVSIASGNVAIQYTSGTTEGDAVDCTVENAGTWNPLNVDVEMMQRDYNTKGVCKVTIENVELKVDVPENQTPGTYESTFTVTLPNF